MQPTDEQRRNLHAQADADSLRGTAPEYQAAVAMREEIAELEAQLAEARAENERETGRAVLMQEHYRGEKTCPDPDDSCWGCSLRQAEAREKALDKLSTTGRCDRCGDAIGFTQEHGIYCGCRHHRPCRHHWKEAPSGKCPTCVALERK